MVLSDFLPRMEGDERNPHEVTPLLINIHSILTSQYHTTANDVAKTYRVQIRSATKAAGFQMYKVC